MADGPSHSFDYASAAASDAASRVLVANGEAVYALDLFVFKDSAM